MELADRIRHIHDCAREVGVPLAAAHSSPIFFVRCGPVNLSISSTRAVWDRGYYVCVTAFPAVPMNDGGIRFTASRHQSFEDIERFLGVLGEVLDEQGVTSAPV